MGALYFEIFPEKEKKYMNDLEEQNAIYKQEFDDHVYKLEEEIRISIKKLSKAELQKELLAYKLDELH